jgi:acyl-homoserine-lactone acylase
MASAARERGECAGDAEPRPLVKHRRDRDGNAVRRRQVVPDVDAAMLQRCAPSKDAAALRGAAGLVVLDGSKSACDWRRDPASPVPGLTPIGRMPIAVRGDWVQNSNDSFFHTHPAQRFGDISPLVGDARVERPRTRAGRTELPELLARGKATPEAVQQQLFANRNHMGGVVVPDLLTALPPTHRRALKRGMAARRVTRWDRTNSLEARGAHLFQSSGARRV